MLLGQKRLQRFAVGFVGQADAVLQRHLHDAHPAVRRAHHPAQRDLAVCGQKTGGAAVGDDHEFFNQLAGPVLHLLPDVGDAVAFKQGFGLEGFKLQRAFGPAQHAQLLGQLVLQAQLGAHALDKASGLGQFAFPFDPGRYRVIGQFGFVAHPGPVDGGGDQDAVFAEHHVVDQRHAVLVRVERSQVGAQAFGQHGKHHRRGVDRGGVGAGMLVDGRAFFDQGVDIGNGHHHPHLALVQGLDASELIQVARVVVVDGAPQQVGELADVVARLEHRPLERMHLPFHGWRELGQ